jgi:phosphoribosyl 1,2-cyclic phosphate phosphodiesterase
MRTCTLIDDRLLIDCGPDLIGAMLRYSLDLAAVRTLLVTHEHHDHLDLLNLIVREAGFCPTPLPLLEVFGSPSSLARIRTIGLPEERLSLRLHPVGPFQVWEVDGYRIAALRARHGEPPMEPLFYAIDDGGCAILYAHDTGPFPDDTWAFLTQPPLGQPWSFDLVTFDTTNGLADVPPGGHMGLAEVVVHRDRLAALGLLRPGARIIANHFSHNSTPHHGELVLRLGGSGIEPAYDGMRIDM